jgi:hypothetical protein
MSLSARHDFWSAVVTQFHRSGLTQADFCRTTVSLIGSASGPGLNEAVDTAL